MLHGSRVKMEKAMIIQFFGRTYQQRPVDLGYNNRSYSPNSAAATTAALAAASAESGWATHPALAVAATPEWIDARAGQHAATGLGWPHNHDQRLVVPAKHEAPCEDTIGHVSVTCTWPFHSTYTDWHYTLKKFYSRSNKFHTFLFGRFRF